MYGIHIRNQLERKMFTIHIHEKRILHNLDRSWAVHMFLNFPQIQRQLPVLNIHYLPLLLVLAICYTPSHPALSQPIALPHPHPHPFIPTELSLKPHEGEPGIDISTDQCTSSNPDSSASDRQSSSSLFLHCRHIPSSSAWCARCYMMQRSTSADSGQKLRRVGKGQRTWWRNFG